MDRPQIKYDSAGNRTFFLDGEQVTEEAFNERLPPQEIEGNRNAPPTTGWPLNAGDSLGVHPSQVEQANARAKRHGINVTYDQHGNPHVPDRAEYGKLLKLEGKHLNNAFGRC